MLFHYTNLVAFSEIFTQPDALCPWYPKQNQLVCNIILHLLNTRIILLWKMIAN